MSIRVPIAPARTSRFRRWRLRLAVAIALLCGLLVFAFCTVRGLDSESPNYLAQVSLLWTAAAVGIGSSLYVLKRGRRGHRILMMISLALILSSIPVLLFLQRASATPAPRPPVYSDTAE